MITFSSYDLKARGRRNRQTGALRLLSRETSLIISDLITPFFLIPGKGKKSPIPSLPGIYSLSPDLLVKEGELLHTQGIQAIALFPVIPKELKDRQGSEALNPNGVIPKTIELLKKELPTLCVIADIALDPYTSHGHDGVVSKKGTIDNDETLDILGKQALIYAEAGADIVAPSATMDGRVQALRATLDRELFTNLPILSYTAKYASSLYAPFRGALQTSLAFGDKKTYQLNPANRREAIREALSDQSQGADMLLIKPALPYLDVIAAIREKTFLPVGAYQVSGEYAMIMAAAKLGLLDADQALYETLISIKRAGADFIFTYATKRILNLLNSSNLPS